MDNERNNALEEDLMDDDLAEFFKEDDTLVINSSELDEKEKARNTLNSLIDTFNVKKNAARAASITDMKELKEMATKIKENIQSFKEIYGEEVQEKLAYILDNEEELEKILQEFLDRRTEMLTRIKAVKDVTEIHKVPKEVEQLFIKFAAMHPELDTVHLYYDLSDMISKRNEMLEEHANGGNTTKVPKELEDAGIDPSLIGAAIGAGLGLSMAQIITQEDKEAYLRDFFNKVNIIQEKTGIELDKDFIEFFTSDEYITNNDLTLPPMLQDENYDNLKDTWSLPVMVEDSREEEANKELFQADESVKSLETYYAQNYGDTQDNNVIAAIKELSGDVEEEKKRIENDIEFFKREKLKERVEVAILASLAGHQANKKIDTLANLLKEKITNRINYMNDEKNLREMRKQNINDMSNKDNERNSAEYFEALQGVNNAINKRREERANGQVKFTPRIILAKNELKKSEMKKDADSINKESMSMGGRQKVLSYVNKHTNSENNAS